VKAVSEEMRCHASQQGVGVACRHVTCVCQCVEFNARKGSTECGALKTITTLFPFHYLHYFTVTSTTGGKLQKSSLPASTVKHTTVVNIDVGCSSVPSNAQGTEESMELGCRYKSKLQKVP
jgi:hypothetical protein